MPGLCRGRVDSLVEKMESGTRGLIIDVFCLSGYCSGICMQAVWRMLPEQLVGDGG